MRNLIAVVLCCLALPAALLSAPEKGPGRDKQPPDSDRQFKDAPRGEGKQPTSNEKPASDEKTPNEKADQSALVVPEAKTYVDEEYGFRLEVPADWPRTDPAAFSVEVYGGEICRVWSIDGLASIVVFVQHSGLRVSPRELVEAYALTESLHVGAQVQEKEVRKVAGLPATSLVMLGDGTGGSLDGVGDIPTSVHWVAIPRKSMILNFLLTVRELDFESADKAFQAMLGTLKVDDAPTDDTQTDDTPSGDAVDEEEHEVEPKIGPAPRRT